MQIRKNRSSPRLPGRLGLVPSLLLLTGCGAMAHENAAFPLRIGEARDYLKELRGELIELERPLIVLAGWGDPGIGNRSVARRLRRATRNPEYVIHLDFFTASDFDDAAERVIERVNGHFPSDDPHRTVEVDVIGISMGGLVARHAARDRSSDTPRLRIARLFSISTPHLGANFASLPGADRKQLDMRINSPFIEELNDDPTSRDFEIVPYVRLGDMVVGAENTAPPGRHPWWISNPQWQPAHLTSPSDPRILADILRRLQGLNPFTRGEPVPLPEESPEFD